MWQVVTVTTEVVEREGTEMKTWRNEAGERSGEGRREAVGAEDEEPRFDCLHRHYCLRTPEPHMAILTHSW